MSASYIDVKDDYLVQSVHRQLVSVETSVSPRRRTGLLHLVHTPMSSSRSEPSPCRFCRCFAPMFYVMMMIVFLVLDRIIAQPILQLCPSSHLQRSFNTNPGCAFPRSRPAAQSHTIRMLFPVPLSETPPPRPPQPTRPIPEANRSACLTDASSPINSDISNRINASPNPNSNFAWSAPSPSSHCPYAQTGTVSFQSSVRILHPAANGLIRPAPAH